MLGPPVGDLDGGLSFWLWSGPALEVADPWGSEPVSGSLPFSCLSAFQEIKNKNVEVYFDMEILKSMHMRALQKTDRSVH